MISPMISPNFKKSNLDTEVLENMNAITPSDELSKALKKEGLVQKDVTVQGKNGTYTRKQWVRASEATSGDNKSTSTEQPKEDKTGKTKDKKPSIHLVFLKVRMLSSHLLKCFLQEQVV